MIQHGFLVALETDSAKLVFISDVAFFVEVFLRRSVKLAFLVKMEPLSVEKGVADAIVQLVLVGVHSSGDH